jgi:hypothetical protein
MRQIETCLAMAAAMVRGVRWPVAQVGQEKGRPGQVRSHTPGYESESA